VRARLGSHARAHAKVKIGGGGNFLQLADQTTERETLFAEDATTRASGQVRRRRVAQAFAPQVSLLDLNFALLTIHLLHHPDYK
jgi:hypothetical protein